MPNWCNNYAKFSHSNPEMLEKLKRACETESVCETFCPVSTEGDLVDAQTAAWGTKWDFGIDGPAVVDNTLSGYFDTAYTPPLGIYDVLSELGFHVEAYWHEGGLCFAGEYETGLGAVDYENIRYTEEGLEGLPEHIVDTFNLEDYLSCDDQEDSDE